MECKTHPDAPHGFLRNASHTEGRYVCECEYWKEHMTKDEALQMCLEYIETNAHERRCVRWAIKDALAEPVQDAQPQSKWVGLTKEEIVQIDMRYHHDTWQLIKEAEAKLKEKNA